MGKVIDIDEIKPHTVSEVICVKCYSRWYAVRPKGTLLKSIECKNCGQGFVINTGEDIIDGEGHSLKTDDIL
jgi:hypothetical protein